ncbi:MAG: CBS domain-containing protein [Candidatus Kariarchaeaceae archaeon]|jgi:CBS domain-containing protein
MQVREAMVHRDKLVTVSPSDTVQIAMEKMVKNNVGSVIVTQIKDKAIGIVTTQDIMVEFLRSGITGFETTLNKIMSVNLITIDEFEALNQAIQKLQESSTHHLLVTTDGGNLAGILSSFDIVRERSLDIKTFPRTRK